MRIDVGHLFGGRSNACCKVVVAASSHRRSLGLITQKSQIRAAKQTPIWQSATVSQAGKKAMGAEAECLILSFGRLGVCYLLASGWQ